MKCGSVLVAEPDLPVASPFLGKVTERCKVASSGMLKKNSPVGAGMGCGGCELKAFHTTPRSPLSESLCVV